LWKKPTNQSGTGKAGRHPAHFQYDWQEVANITGLLAAVEAERQRLGSNHPLF